MTGMTGMTGMTWIGTTGMTDKCLESYLHLLAETDRDLNILDLW